MTAVVLRGRRRLIVEESAPAFDRTMARVDAIAAEVDVQPDEGCS